MQGLHAQALKAYAVAEIEVIDAAAQAAHTPQVVAALRAAGGLPIKSAGGRIVAYVDEAPKRVAISEWGSLEQAQAFLNSPGTSRPNVTRPKRSSEAISWRTRIRPIKLWVPRGGSGGRPGRRNERCPHDAFAAGIRTYMRDHALSNATTADPWHALDAVDERVRYYSAVASALDPVLSRETLSIALTGELPTSLVDTLIFRVAGEGEQPDLAWSFVQANFDALATRQGPSFRNYFASNLMTNFTDAMHPVRKHSRTNLPRCPASHPIVHGWQ